MSQLQTNIPLNNHQLEILKLFSREMEDSDLIEIKRLIVKYLADKVTEMTSEIWEEKNWTNEDMDRLLKSHNRTPYNPKN
jgi:hypothetical protein